MESNNKKRDLTIIVVVSIGIEPFFFALVISINLNITTSQIVVQINPTFKKKGCKTIMVVPISDEDGDDFFPNKKHANINNHHG